MMIMGMLRVKQEFMNLRLATSQGLLKMDVIVFMRKLLNNAMRISRYVCYVHSDFRFNGFNE